MSVIELTEISVPRKVYSTGRTATTPDGTKTTLEEVNSGNISGRQSPLFNKIRKETIISNVQLGTLCWSLFILGWNDGSTGPLLPRMREVYDVGFTVVSLLFVLACTGFIIGSLLNVWLTDRFGFGKVITLGKSYIQLRHGGEHLIPSILTRYLGAALPILTYSVQAPAPPFAVFGALNMVNGIGLALQVAQALGFVGAMKDHPETKMGMVQASYGLGALASPLIATQFAQLRRWSFHYLVSLGLAITNTVLLAVVFRFKDQTGGLIMPCLIEGGERVDVVTGENGNGKFRQMMTSKTVHFLALFILVYVGVEVTIGGWIVTYLIEVRGGGHATGYVSSGFFGGMMLGRVGLLPVNKYVGEHRVVFIYAILAVGLDFIVWFVPSLVGNAITASIIGVLLGPMYPIAMNQASRVLPPWILTGSIGWIAGFGQAGSAIIPFMTGAIAQKHGIKSIQPLLVAMMGLMTILFWITPSEPPHEGSAEAEAKATA